jgi:hypothetical protein
MVDIGITGSLSMSRAFVDQSYCVVISEIMKKVDNKKEVAELTLSEGARFREALRARIIMRGAALATLQLDFVFNDGEVGHEVFELIGIPTRFGGLRWYGRGLGEDGGQRCSKLYLPPGEREFGSREFHMLRHRRRSPGDRDMDRALKIAAKLGMDDLIVPPLRKPKGMRQKAFDRLYRELTRLHTRAQCAALGLPPPDLFGDERDERERQRHFEREERKRNKE